MTRHIRPRPTKVCGHIFNVEIENEIQPNSMMEEGMQVTPYIVARCTRCGMELDADDIRRILNTYVKG